MPRKAFPVDERLEQILEAASSRPTRRAVMRGVAGVLGAMGVVALARQEDSSARRRRRRRRRNECRRASQCPTPFNPCQKARCKNNRCRNKTLANGTICGDGLVCQNGACLCPDGVCTVQVTMSNLNGWHGFDECVCQPVEDSVLTFRTGPATPPYGTGSVELTAPDQEMVSLGTFQFANVFLSDITALMYSTFNEGPEPTVGILTFGIDFFGSNPTFSMDSLVFDPAANGQTIVQDTWHEWDAINGGAALCYYNGGGFDWPNTNPPIPDTDPLSWAQIVATYPEARIRVNDSQFLITTFGDGAPFTEAINSVTFGTTSGTTRFVFGPA